jgi:hypothetical protein
VTTALQRAAGDGAWFLAAGVTWGFFDGLIGGGAFGTVVGVFAGFSSQGARGIVFAGAGLIVGLFSGATIGTPLGTVCGAVLAVCAGVARARGIPPSTIAARMPIVAAATVTFVGVAAVGAIAVVSRDLGVATLYALTALVALAFGVVSARITARGYLARKTLPPEWP